MASSNTPTTFGATIVPTTTKKPDGDLDLTLPLSVHNSPALTPAVSREDFSSDISERRVPPHSAFYEHPPASFEKVHSRNTSRVAVVNEKDLEAGIRTPLTNENGDNPFVGKVSVDCNKECRMWPSKQTIMQERAADRKKRREDKMCGGCGPVVDFWSRFTKKQKLIIKIVLALLFIGIVVGIAVGITVAVNGGVYVSEGHQEQIPDPGDNN